MPASLHAYASYTAPWLDLSVAEARPDLVTTGRGACMVLFTQHVLSELPAWFSTTAAAEQSLRRLTESLLPTVVHELAHVLDRDVPYSRHLPKNEVRREHLKAFTNANNRNAPADPKPSPEGHELAFRRILCHLRHRWQRFAAPVAADRLFQAELYGSSSLDDYAWAERFSMARHTGRLTDLRTEAAPHETRKLWEGDTAALAAASPPVTLAIAATPPRETL